MKEYQIEEITVVFKTGEIIRNRILSGFNQDFFDDYKSSRIDQNRILGLAAVDNTEYGFRKGDVLFIKTKKVPKTLSEYIYFRRALK
jgi:hypothetical protein